MRMDSCRSDVAARCRQRSVAEYAILCIADVEANAAIAQRFKLSNTTVGKWCARFVERFFA